MASVKSLKRKSRHEDLLEAPAAPLLSSNGHGIDMASDSENDEDFVPGDEDDQDDEEFPEIDTNSDSDDQGDDSDEPDEDDEDESSDATSVSDEVNIGPKAKTVISDITGRPKRVYPEIEPDYDSDSSTEEVRAWPLWSRSRLALMSTCDFCRTQIASGMCPCTGMTICLTSATTWTARKSSVLQKATSSTSSLRPSMTQTLGEWPHNLLFAPCAVNSQYLHRTTAFDKSGQTDKPLTGEELEIIRRLQAGENPDEAYDPYEPMVEWFTGKGKEEIMPLSAAPEPKRRWVPSKWEKKKVRRRLQ